MSVGYIYIMTNSSMPGLVKIGLTRNDVHQRARDLGSTGVPTPFEVQYYCLTRDCEEVESHLHSHFGTVRAPGREFFSVSLVDAVRAADNAMRPVEPDRFCAIKVEAAAASAKEARPRMLRMAPDWYPDPKKPGMFRYWDGQKWTGKAKADRQPPA